MAKRGISMFFALLLMFAVVSDQIPHEISHEIACCAAMAADSSACAQGSQAGIMGSDTQDPSATPEGRRALMRVSEMRLFPNAHVSCCQRLLVSGRCAAYVAQGVLILLHSTHRKLVLALQWVNHAKRRCWSCTI
jgi:hypothetical protein